MDWMNALEKNGRYTERRLADIRDMPLASNFSCETMEQMEQFLDIQEKPPNRISLRV